jgi:hypothetical protein
MLCGLCSGWELDAPEFVARSEHLDAEVVAALPWRITGPHQAEFVGLFRETVGDFNHAAGLERAAGTHESAGAADGDGFGLLADVTVILGEAVEDDGNANDDALAAAALADWRFRHTVGPRFGNQVIPSSSAAPGGRQLHSTGADKPPVEAQVNPVLQRRIRRRRGNGCNFMGPNCPVTQQGEKRR